MYRFKAIPIKIPARLFIGIDKVIPKIICKSKESKITKIILKKKMGRISLSHFETYNYCNQNCVVLVERQTHRSLQKMKKWLINRVRNWGKSTEKRSHGGMRGWPRGSRWGWGCRASPTGRPDGCSFYLSFGALTDTLAWLKGLLPQCLQNLQQTLLFLTPTLKRMKVKFQE